MKERVYNKLVRDNIPDIIRESGETPVIRTLEDEEFRECLGCKLRFHLQNISQRRIPGTHFPGEGD